MKRYFLFLFTGLISFLLNAETPGWIHNAAISPDGETIAFSYKGELFKVSSKGGLAVRLTSDSGYDGYPVWSTDSKKIAFLSTREGSDDVFLINAEGGTPKRLTTHSKNEFPLTFINDSILLINANLRPGEKTSRAPFLTQVYSLNINIDNPRPYLFLSLPVESASANRKGEILFQDKKSFEDSYRKHERSSGTSDIVLYDNGIFTKLTDFNGAELSPAWGKDSTYFYLSDEDGNMNVYSTSINKKEKKKITNFEKNPVRSLTSSYTDLLAFTQDGDIYTLIPGKEPSKLKIEIESDFYDSDNIKRYLRSGATSVDISPDGKQIAFVIRGELYVTDAKYSVTKRITDTSAQERQMSFSPDGRSLVFDSDKDGIWTLYIAKIKNPEEKNFISATDIEIEPLYSCATSAMQPLVSPDGKKVAFLEDRNEIKVIDLKTKETNTALPAHNHYSYEDGDITFQWSPDSKWLVSDYMGKGGWNNMDIAVFKADGSEIINLTESGYVNSNPKWALDGKAITFATSHYGMKSHGSWGNQEDVMLMVLDPETWENFNMTKEEIELLKINGNKDDDSLEKKSKQDKAKAKKEKDLDFKNAKYRTLRLTPYSSELMDYYLSPKGDRLYYIARGAEGEGKMFEVDLLEKERRVLFKEIQGFFIPDESGENVFIFSEEGIGKIDFDEPAIIPIEFEAPYNRHPSLERQYIFDHVAKQVEDKFYDKNLHGVDWKYYTEHYRNFLPQINNNRDFAILLSELLGELNASHTGARYKPDSSAISTSSLGAYFDDSFTDDGLKITEILPRGPLAMYSANLEPGDIILSIDGEIIKAGKDYYPLLEGKAGRKVRLEILKRNGKKNFITVKPVSDDTDKEDTYKRWIERNENYVDSISNGKVGYVHVRGMDGPSFQDVYAKMLGKYRNADAIVVDTRYNGGGWLHNDLAVLLNGHKYVTFAPRDEEIGIEPFSQWTKPSVMLINEFNYSDAHGSPFAYKSLGLGELVGAPVPGTMTAVWWETQVDPTIVFGIPQVTNIANDGTILENHQLDPDIIIYNSPEQIEEGLDAQLQGAVMHLLKKTENKQQQN